ncbi:MAG: hypothetical protein Q4A66_10945, partial [Eubacteriales bacterium]|nr:hypothetical protein [Eubacteriales bacterium]
MKKIVAFISGIAAEIGKEKIEFPLVLPGEDVKAAVREFAYEKVEWMFETFDRAERQAREEEVKAGRNPLFQSHLWDGSAIPLDENLEIAVELLEKSISPDAPIAVK